MTDIRPVGNIVIIELVKRARESKSGIITTVEEEYMDYGVVYKIGSLVREPEYATGDKVLFDTKGATRYNLPDKEVMVVDSRVIQCVLVETEPQEKLLDEKFAKLGEQVMDYEKSKGGL